MASSQEREYDVTLVETRTYTIRVPATTRLGAEQEAVAGFKKFGAKSFTADKISKPTVVKVREVR